ncbi:hypothetical protein OsI_38269 [Oryza sativa Indica Group]|uniref:Uncharacterized protein n=1 Tax=Oryza sativa subsp. indica TaxID=39946 RepID=A2ZKB8_ORYSI|nr:hypothetical protein OsI_38269 [Oryza sativa Indica Group]
MAARSQRRRREEHTGLVFVLDGLEEVRADALAVANTLPTARSTCARGGEPAGFAVVELPSARSATDELPIARSTAAGFTVMEERGRWPLLRSPLAPAACEGGSALLSPPVADPPFPGRVVARFAVPVDRHLCHL